MSILIVAEHRSGQMNETTVEAIGKGREISSSVGVPLKAALFGKDVESLASELASYPLDEVLVVEDEGLGGYTPEVYGAALRQLLQAEDYNLVMAGHTATGYEFLPRIAGDLGKPCVTDAVNVTLEGQGAVVTRMGYNGKVAVELEVGQADPCFVTLRPGVGKAPEKVGNGVSVTKASLESDDLEVYREILGYEKPEAEDIDISEADVVIAVGRGIKEKENLKLIEDLAKALGGVVAGSRPIIDKDWLPWSRQVGSSGKTVRPKLYMACGISGAMQHITGMKSSKTIVAINVDPTAPIFGVAHYGVVGDMFKVIPALLKGLGRA